MTDQQSDKRTSGDHEANCKDASDDPGAYIGRLPERATETIPGGLGPRDVRVAANATQPGPVRGQAPGEGEGIPPDGQRPASDAAAARR